MPNFDALRPVIIPTLAYICRQKLPPEELLFCCNFIDGRDLSRYGGSVVISGGTEDRTTYDLPGINNPTITISLGKEFKRDEPWSIDIVMGKPGNNSLQLATAGLYLQSDASSYEPGGVLVDGVKKINRGGYEGVTGMIQWAYRYDGSEVYYYCQGTINKKNGSGGVWTGTLSSNSSNSASITPPSTGGFAGCTIIAARIIQKAIGTSSTYPTTNSLYTGFEVL